MKKRNISLLPASLRKEYDWAYSRRVYPRLLKRYPNQWVAFAHRRILAHGKALTHVLQQARKTLQSWPEIPHLFLEKGIHIYDAHHP